MSGGPSISDNTRKVKYISKEKKVSSETSSDPNITTNYHLTELIDFFLTYFFFEKTREAGSPELEKFFLI